MADVVEIPPAVATAVSEWAPAGSEAVILNGEVNAEPSGVVPLKNETLVTVPLPETDASATRFTFAGTEKTNPSVGEVIETVGGGETEAGVERTYEKPPA